MRTVEWLVIVVGCAGGLIPDVLRIIKGRYRKQVPRYLKTLNFWLGVVLLVILGGLAAWVLGATNVKEALAYGFAAPEIISRLAAKSIEEVDRGEAPLNVREWWGS